MDLIIKLPDDWEKRIGEMLDFQIVDFLYGIIRNGTPIPDNATVCDIEQIRDKLISMSFRYSMSRECEYIRIEEWTDRLIKNSDVLKVFEEYQKGDKE